MGSPIPMNGAQAIRPDAKLDILDVVVDGTAAVRCRCVNAPTFLVRLTKNAVCPSCRTAYAVRSLSVTPDGHGSFQIGIQVGPAEASPIVAPGGPRGT